MEYTPFELPKSFLLGSATASLQIEGGDRNNNWFRWCEQKRIKDGSHCVSADDHWNRVDEDIALMKKLNHQVYRLGIEWSRIEPAKGEFDKAAVNHYRDEITKLKAAGIEPLVTLHHFSNPLWMEDAEAWTNPESIDLFVRYARFVVENLGDLVSKWVTINEPNVYLAFGYVFGLWPPGENSILKYFKGAKHMAKAHIAAYRLIHEIRKSMNKTDTQVGVAYHIRLYDPKKNTGLTRWVARNVENLFQDIFINAMTTGKFTFPIGHGYPMGKAVVADFFGINYYTRDMISFAWNPGMLFAKLDVKEDSERNDLNWEIYPEGLTRVLKKYHERFHLPILITENGTCDAKDAFRTKYIYTHLKAVKDALDAGVDVREYYHWSTMDNFEWVEGESAKFGLIEVDYSNQKRTIRRSGEFYGEALKNKAVTADMIKRYL